jgi:hypothetical protein
LAEAPPDHPSNTFLRRSLSSENDRKTQKDISEEPSPKNNRKERMRSKRAKKNHNQDLHV